MMITGPNDPASAMTKREMFAMAAMTGYLSMFGGINIPAPEPEVVSAWSISYADALLAKLAETQEPHQNDNNEDR